MLKSAYIEPEMELARFLAVDVLTTSDDTADDTVIDGDGMFS